MKLQDSKEYYYLDDTAEILKCKERDLIHYGANGKLRISTRINPGDCFQIESINGEFKGYGYIELCCWILKQDLLAFERAFDAGEIDIEGFYPHPSEVEGLIHYNQDLDEPINPDNLKDRMYFVRPTTYTVKCKEMFIMQEDLQQFMNDYSVPEIDANAGEHIPDVPAPGVADVPDLQADKTDTSQKQITPNNTHTEPRHVFSEEERSNADRKGCLQYAVEAYLDKNVDGEWKGFMKFINAKLQLPKEEILCKKESYNFYFDKVINTALFMKHPKLGKKEGKQGWNQHSADYVSAIIRAEKRKRKKKNN